MNPFLNVAVTISTYKHDFKYQRGHKFIPQLIIMMIVLIVYSSVLTWKSRIDIKIRL